MLLRAGVDFPRVLRKGISMRTGTVEARERGEQGNTTATS